jgi:acetyl esterase
MTTNNQHWMSLVAGREIQLPRRERLQDLIDSRAFFDSIADVSDLPENVTVEEVVLREREGKKLTAEIYVPSGKGPFPLWLHIHGGGWCVGSAMNDRKLAMRYAQRGYVVASIDYALAPEHPFPWAVEDALYSLRWLSLHGSDFGGDIDRVVIEGGSAGANLAVAAMLAQDGSPLELDEGDLAGISVNVSAAILSYGVFDFVKLLLEPGSNVGSAELWARGYLGPHFTTRLREPLASPVYSESLSSLPPCYLNCGSQDSLLGHTLSLGDRLAASHVPVTLSVIAGADHGMLKAADSLPLAAEEIDHMFEWVTRQLADGQQ